jgi:hypothetical protein
MVYKKELPEWKLNVEFQRKIALECSRRCLLYKKEAESASSYTLDSSTDLKQLNAKITYSE